MASISMPLFRTPTSTPIAHSAEAGYPDQIKKTSTHHSAQDDLMAADEISEPWTDSASLIGVQNLPIHGTVASCIRAWRVATKKERTSAVLLTVRPIRALASDKASATFKGEALEDLSTAMPKSMDLPTGPVLGGLSSRR